MCTFCVIVDNLTVFTWYTKPAYYSLVVTAAERYTKPAYYSLVVTTAERYCFWAQCMWVCLLMGLCVRLFTLFLTTMLYSGPSISLSHFDLERSMVKMKTTFKLACLTYKLLTTGQPAYLRTLLHHYTPTRTLRSTNQFFLDLLRFSTEFSKRSFNYLALEWSRSTSWYQTFTDFRHLKTLHFQIAHQHPYHAAHLVTASATDSVSLLNLRTLYNFIHHHMHGSQEKHKTAKMLI